MTDSALLDTGMIMSLPDGGPAQTICPARQGDCDEDGECEQSLLDTDHCGACGDLCRLNNTAAESCATGVCRVVSCSSDFRDCDGLDENGCEASILDDPEHCGGCLACRFAHADADCINGTCVQGLCDPGYGDCDPEVPGCETALNTLDRCGGCDRVCDLPNAYSDCSTGECVVSGCVPGFGDCSTDAPGCETQLNTANDCAQCNVPCTEPPGAKCDTGVCTDLVCPSGIADCDAQGLCNDNLFSLAHCGTCNSPCSRDNATASCASGGCEVSSCNTGYANCDAVDSTGCEINLRTDARNCGTCRNDCTVKTGVASATCAAGVCQNTCLPSYADCNGDPNDGCETALATTDTNCGSCGNNCTSLPHGAGRCAAGECVVQSCHTNWQDCNNNPADGCERNLQSDSNHCGQCGNACDTSNTSVLACVSGRCQVSQCVAGYRDCDMNQTTNNGCEVFTSGSDNGNCGGCGVSCSTNPSNGTASCSSGSCSIVSCNGAFRNCVGGVADGCETNTLTNANHCNGCNQPCTYSHATGVCNNGTCALGTCAAGYQNCNGSAADGCETNVQGTDNSHCGACNAVCGNQNTQPGGGCGGGGCSYTCAAGYADCNNNKTDGCESSLSSDLTCGNCTTTCGTNESCNPSTRTCQPDPCVTPTADCNGSPTSCETNLHTSLTNCGMCGRVCNPPNAVETCSAGVCGFSGCDPGYQNCNNVTADGCEAHTAADPTRCGSCNNVCSFANAAATCVSGACQMGACNTGYANCNGGTGNGCETSITTVSDCGGCGITCSSINGTASCNASTSKCQMACTGAYRDCDTVGSNGCEINSATNAAHCGACNNACSAGWVCQDGGCVNPAAIKTVRSGNNFSCALTYGGSIECWGRNHLHQLGATTSSTSQATPVTVAGGLTFTALGVGDDHACGISNGQVYCWGNAADGRAGIDPVTVNSVRNGCPALQLCSATATGITGAVEVDAGATFSCARLSNGRISCWGRGQNGEIGNGVATIVETKGAPLNVVQSSLSPLTDVVSLSVGTSHSCAVRSNGTLYCWGLNADAQLGYTPTGACGACSEFAAQVTGLSSIAQVGAGQYHTCARLSDNSVRCWGDNTHGQLGVEYPSNASKVAESATPLVTKYCAGTNPCASADALANLTGVSDLGVGSNHNCVVMQNGGGVRCWGLNSTGAVDVTRASPQWAAVAVTGASNAVSAAGVRGSPTNSCTLLSNTAATGSLQCWGRGTYGNLGNGQMPTTSGPVLVMW